MRTFRMTRMHLTAQNGLKAGFVALLATLPVACATDGSTDAAQADGSPVVGDEAAVVPVATPKGTTVNITDTACRSGDLGGCRRDVTELTRNQKFAQARHFSRLLTDAHPIEAGGLLRYVDDEQRRFDAGRLASRSACNAKQYQACSSLGFLLIKEGQAAEGAALLRMSCEGGEFRVCQRLVDVARSQEERVFAMRRGCEGRIASMCYDYGMAVDKSGRSSEASQAFTFACRERNGGACAVLAEREFDNGGYKAARGFGDVACSQKVELGCFVAALSEERIGHTEEARRAFLKMCDTTPVACRALGNLELRQGDMRQAKRFLSKACQGNDHAACLQLADVERDHGDQDFALRLYASLCDHGEGSPKACTNAGLLETSKRKVGDAHRHYRRACDRSDALACLNLGYLEASSGNRDGANRAFNTACSLGDSIACGNLGRGEPPVKRTSEAETSMALKPRVRDLFNRQCDAGNEEACRGQGVPAH